ncbi:MAG TPA: PASTA domain-containing protein [Abditibacteriaceae bacterium]|nr:PASTA domain-containing protein [Abditibacteriaceae bacterium]
MLATGMRGARRGAGGPADDDSAASRYEVLERVGEGSLFVVYRVRDRTTNGVLALKALKGTFARHPRFGRVLSEVLQRTRAMRHPHLAQIGEVGDEEGTLFFTGEWLPGPSLEARLRRAPFSRATTEIYLRQIAEALDYLHDNGAPHGDLRPRQILSTAEGDLKLTDVGAAEAFMAADMTPVDMQYEAAYYMSPERFDGAPPSPAADLYAMGVILYRMLTGRVPFDGPSPLSIAMRHRKDAPLRPSQYNRACPPHLEKVALRLLEKDLTRRYASAGDLLYELTAGNQHSAQQTGAAAGAVATRPAPPTVPAAPTRPTPPTTPAAAIASTATPPAPAAPPAPVAPSAASLDGAADAADDVPADDDLAPPSPLQRVLSTGSAARRQPRTASLDADQVARKRHWMRELLGAFLALFWLLVAAGLLAAIIFGSYHFWIKEIPKEVSVPKYLGLNQQQAESVLEKAGLKLQVRDYDYDAKRPVGTVLSGDQPAGKRVRTGREIWVTVSQGEAPLKMYDFSELSLERARRITARYGMRVGQVSEQYHDTVPKGYICGQYPEPGEAFRRSEPINFIVSLGTEPSSETRVAAPLPPPPVPLEDPAASIDEVAPPSEDAGADGVLVSRDVAVRVALPADGSRQEVRIVVHDAEGEHMVYRKTHDPGDLVDETITVVRRQGTTATVSVYIGKTLRKQSRV